MTVDERQALDGMLQAAALGVSADNGQPWRFKWRAGRLLIFLDAARAASFFDRAQNAAQFGIGSVVENLSIAAAHWGYQPLIHFFPDATRADLMPIISIAFTRVLPQPHPLYPAIQKRTTNRRPYTGEPVPADIKDALAEIAGRHGGLRLIFVETERPKRRLGDLIAKADAIRFNFSSRQVHDDFFSRLRYNRREAHSRRDGLWIDCLEAGISGKLALRLLSYWPVARTASRLGVGKLLGGVSAQLLEHTPLMLLIIGTTPVPDSESRRFLLGGRLSQELWLTAATHGLACQPLAVLPLFFAQYQRFADRGFNGQTGLTVKQLREEFYRSFTLADEENLLMVFRMGYAHPPSAHSFRRRIEEMVSIEDDSALTMP